MHVECTDRERCVTSSLNVDSFLCSADLSPSSDALSRESTPSAFPSHFPVAINVCARRSLTADQPELHAKWRDSEACLCKLASLTAEVAPVKSPKDHVATRGPGTPKVHHGTQNAVQVVVHLRNTQASSGKELPAALRRHSGHESSADWLTATEQRDKNVAAAYSCLFSLFHPSIFPLLFYRSIPLLYGSILFYRSIGLLFSRPYSLTLTVRAVILFTALLSTRLLRDATVFIFVDRPPCLLLVHEFSFVSRRVGGRRILELGAAFQSSSLFGQPVVRGATFLHQHLSVRIILIESLVAAVIPQVFQRPSQCASIGSLSLVAPTAILIKLFFLLSLLSAGCVCGSVGRCFLSLCVLLSCSTGWTCGARSVLFLTFGSCAEKRKTVRQAFSRKEFCSRADSCRVVALSTAKHRVDVHQVNITHCQRSAVRHSIVCVLLEQRARGASSTAASISELVTGKWQFAGLQRAAELTLIDGERRKGEIVVGAMKTASSEHAGQGTVQQNLL